jgi:flavin reductase (DIM6/NTAB) family NADH-FMN oxidoreductase RutF
MRVHLTNTGAITMLEPAEFRKLDVLIDPQPPEKLKQAISKVGRREDERHIRLAPAVLRFLSGHAGEPKWEDKFVAMIAYAAKAGWVDAHGDLRAHIVCNEMDEVVSEGEFKAAMRALPAGISVVTTGSGAGVAGLIVSSLTSISAEPPLVGFFIHESCSMIAALLANGRFVANVLGENHHALMSCFLCEPQGPGRFSKGDWRSGLHDQPILDDALASVECDIVNTQALGTHRLIVGKIRRTVSRQANPMINFNAMTRRLEPLPIQENHQNRRAPSTSLGCPA